MIAFNGIDIIAARSMGDDEVRRALSLALSIPEQRVAVIDDVGSYPERDAADIVCVRSPLDGDFTCLLSIQSAELMLPYGTREALAQRICDLLQTECLVPDEGANPYVMWLIVPGEPPRRVELDPVALDEDRYVIARR